MIQGYQKKGLEVEVWIVESLLMQEKSDHKGQCQSIWGWYRDIVQQYFQPLCQVWKEFQGRGWICSITDSHLGAL